MSPLEQLAHLVAGAPGAIVMPVRPRSAGIEVPTPLRLIDALNIGDFLWVTVIADANGDHWTVPLVEGPDSVRRAVSGDGAAQALVRLIGTTPDRADGDAFGVRTWHAEPVDGERAITVDQTHESIVVGERAVVKWTVHLSDHSTAEHPAAQRIATLADQDFRGTPSPWGLLQWQGDGRATLLASVAEFLPGAVDGWDWAVADVRSLARRDVTFDAALTPARELGILTARMHAAFASQGHDNATIDDVRAWEARARNDLDEAVRVVDGPEGRHLCDRADRIAQTFDMFTDVVGTAIIDVHGDLHVGQVLRHGTPPEYAIIDFDGNPVLDADDRARRQPAAVDVAGMLASLDHVGRVVIRRTDGVDARIVRAWITESQREFLGSYRGALSQMHRHDLFDERLLRPLRLQQECREYLYAVRHLPLWRYVPDAALLDLMPDPPPHAT